MVFVMMRAVMIYSGKGAYDGEKEMRWSGRVCERKKSKSVVLYGD
jgi:hypothetical protein